MEQAQGLIDGVDFRDDAYDCLDGADVLVLLTEWTPSGRSISIAPRSS